MFESLETGIGLDIILWFQENRSAWMAALSQILDQLGAELGYVAIFGIVFWAINKRHGIRMIFALVIVAIITFALKDLLMRPRPYVASELVNPVFEAEGFGFPSGHTSFAVMIFGYIALWQKKAWVWILCIAYMILQGVGRMVAGVHYPHDVVAGVLIGIISLVIYYPISKQWGNFWEQQTLITQLIIAIALPLILTVIIILLPLDFMQTEAYLTLFGLALGVGIAATLEPRFIQFEPHPNLPQRIIVVIIGAIITIAILLGLSPLFDLIAETGIVAYILRLVRYGLAGFVAIAIIPWLGIQTNLMQSQSKQKSTTTI